MEKPRALHPIEDAYFHQSHLKGKQDYGHQAVAVMLSCNGIVLNYTFVMYNKSISKINIVENIAKELPVPPVISYFLCDCWYTSEKIINTFAAKGFHTIGALKTNRMLYPFGFKKKDKLALDSYQIRSAQGIRRYWLLMSMAHFMCVAGTGEFCSFEKGYHRIESIIQTEKYQYLFQCAKESNDFDAFMKLAG